jgi:hypothetical protein
LAGRLIMKGYTVYSYLNKSARRLSENGNRSEKPAVRGQVFVGLRVNSTVICRKHTEIWTDQTVSQQVLLFPDNLLEEP